MSFENVGDIPLSGKQFLDFLPKATELLSGHAKINDRTVELEQEETAVKRELFD